MEHKKRMRTIKLFAFLDGLAWVFHLSWIETGIKNHITSVYYGIYFALLIGSISLLLFDIKTEDVPRETDSKKIEENIIKLWKDGVSYRNIAKQVGTNYQKVGRVINNYKAKTNEQ